jgi:hypothetical protein
MILRMYSRVCFLAIENPDKSYIEFISSVGGIALILYPLQTLDTLASSTRPWQVMVGTSMM